MSMQHNNMHQQIRMHLTRVHSLPSQWSNSGTRSQT